MPLPADYHTHTPLCCHARGEPTDLAAQAIAVGLTEMGFSDHNPMAKDDFDDWRMKLGELDLYVEKVQEARRQFPNLAIKLAMEVDFIPGYEDWVRELAARHPWDYFIGSVHYVGTWAIDNPKHISEWKKRDTYEVWEAYFECLTLAAESKLFDIIGHADLCKRFCFYPQQDWTGLAKRFLEAAKRNDVAMEINTAGLRKDCKEMYPHPWIVQEAARLGVALTFGSDAHAPEDVARNWGEALALARGAGYTHWRRFTRQRRHEAVAI
jgi:histidinol-phosphatase (PHP family)